MANMSPIVTHVNLKKRKPHCFLLNFPRTYDSCLYFSLKRRANNLQKGEDSKQPPDI